MAFKMSGYSAFTKKVEGPTQGNPQTTNPKRIPVPDSFEVGSLVPEDWLESQFSQKTGDSGTFPQVSVQDYSEVRQDNQGNLYVEQIPQTESHR